MYNYKVKRFAGGEVSVENAMDMCLDALKEKMWRDVWKQEITLEGVRWTIVERDGGMTEVTAEL